MPLHLEVVKAEAQDPVATPATNLPDDRFDDA